MQKYILFIFSIILCTCSLSAQLKEKVASLTRSLNNLQKFISKPIDALIQDQIERLIFKGTIKTAENLKDYLEAAHNIILTTERANELYKKFKLFVEKLPLEPLLPPDLFTQIYENVRGNKMKSAEDIQKFLNSEGYPATLKQAQELYNKFATTIPSIPSTPPPPLTSKTITADEAFKLIEKNLKLKGGPKIDYRSIDGIMQYLGSLGYIVPSKLAEEIKKLFETRLIEESGKRPRRPTKETETKTVQNVIDAVEAAIASGTTFKDRAAVVKFLQGKGLSPLSDFRENANLTKWLDLKYPE